MKINIYLFQKKTTLCLFSLLFFNIINAQQWVEKSLSGKPRDVVFTKLYDWDKDGDLDIIALERSEDGLVSEYNQDWNDQLVWYENEPKHQFNPHIILYHNLKNSSFFEITDFDKNGKEDFLITANKGIGGISWFQCQPDNSYIQWTVKANRKIHDQQIADFNGDGYFDIIATIENQYEAENKFRTAIFLNDKKGGFAEKPIPQAIGFLKIKVGDLNNDGQLEIIGCEDRSIGNFKLLYGKANIEFNEPVNIDFHDEFDVKEFKLKDYNLDGKLDIAVFYFNSDNPIIVLDGNQNFAINPNLKISPQFDWADQGHILPANFDKNGSFDCIFANDMIQIFHSDTKEKTIVDKGSLYYSPSLTSGDLDGDGDMDVVCAVDDNNLNYFLWLENINGKLYSHMIFGAYENFRTLKITDYDLDGDEDLIFSCADEHKDIVRRNGVYLLENKGDSFYENWVIAQIHHQSLGLDISDFDDDGDLDIACISTKDNSLFIYENNKTPYNWVTRKIASNINYSLNLNSFKHLNKTGILTWNDRDNKVTIYTDLQNTASISSTIIPLPMSPISSVNLVNFQEKGILDLIALSKDTAIGLCVYRVNPDWSLVPMFSLKGYECINSAQLKLLGTDKTSYVFIAKKAKNEINLFELRPSGSTFEIINLYKFNQTNFSSSDESSFKVFKSDNCQIFIDDYAFYSISITEQDKFIIENQKIQSNGSKRIQILGVHNLMWEKYKTKFFADEKGMFSIFNQIK